MKSSEKKFGRDWRSFDPPTGRSNFTIEIHWKCIGNFKKFGNRTFEVSFNWIFFSDGVSGMALTYRDTRSKHLALVCPIPPFSWDVKGVKMGIFEHFRLFWQPKNILKKKMQGKMLWFGITVCQRHPRNPIRKRNSVKTNLKCPIFEFFKISYTFSVDFYSKIRATRGGVKWPSITPKFFFWAFHDICT